MTGDLNTTFRASPSSILRGVSIFYAPHHLIPELIFFLHLTRDYGIIVCVNDLWAISSAGRASALQAECQQFDPVIAHQNEKTSRASCREVFFLLYLSFHCHLTSCIRAHDHLRVALLLQMMFAAEPVRSCYRPPKRRPHVICSMRSFFLPFSFFLCGHLTSCIRDSRSFARRFAPSNDVRCGTSSILFSPTIVKRLHVLRAVRSFFFFTFLFIII